MSFLHVLNKPERKTLPLGSRARPPCGELRPLPAVVGNAPSLLVWPNPSVLPSDKNPALSPFRRCGGRTAACPCEMGEVRVKDSVPFK